VTAIPVSSHLDTTGKRIIGLREGLQWWQTFTLHATGVGQQDMGIWLPVAYNLLAVRYRVAVAGSGGSMTAELRRNGTAGGNTVSGTSATPGTAPSFTTLGSPVAMDADDLLWCYVTTMSHTTVGAQLKAELLLERR